jgi:hypothetical protein
VREGRIRRLVVNMPPRHLKSHLASVSFPAWCLGDRPSLQVLCVSYAQDYSDYSRVSLLHRYNIHRNHSKKHIQRILKSTVY